MKENTIAILGRPTGLRAALTLQQGESISPGFYTRVTRLIVEDLFRSADEPHVAQDGLSDHPVHDNLAEPEPMDDVTQVTLPATYISFAGQNGALKDSVNNYRTIESDKTVYTIQAAYEYNVSISVEGQSSRQVIRLTDYLFRALLEYSAIAFQHIQMSKMTVSAPSLPKAIDKAGKHFSSIIVVGYAVDHEVRIRSQETPLNTIEIR